MGDDALVDLRAALAALLRDPARQQRLYAAGLRFGGLTDRAGELVNTAIVKTLEGTTAWDPVKTPDLLRHLGSVMFTLASNAFRSAGARRERLADDPDLEPPPDSHPNAEGAIVADEAEARGVRRLGRRMVALRADRADDPHVLTLIDCFERDVVKAAAQAKATGWPIADVRRARRRLFERAAIIHESAPDSSGPIAAQRSAS